MISYIRAVLRFGAFVLFAIVGGSAQALALKFKSPLSRTIPRWFHRTMCLIVGFKVEVSGVMSSRKPTLFVSNHMSYLDILVLGSIIPGSFVAKSEISQWPGVGRLARLQETVFIDRKRENVGNHRHDMAGRLEAGDNLIVFPEGTSNDGNRTYPFKSSLFAVANVETAEGALNVQPVSIAYVRLDGLPIGRHLRPFFAWYGDMGFGKHLWQMLRLGLVTVSVQFHPSVSMKDFASRKGLARACEEAVSVGVSRALSGKPLDKEAA